MRGRMLVATVALGATAVAPAGGAYAALPPEHGYVTNALRLPTNNTEATNLGRDVDGDGDRENDLGLVLASLAGQGVDIASAQQEAITTGEIVMLHSLRASSLANTRNATWQVWYGAPTPDPDLTGTGRFTLRTKQPHSLKLAAKISDHRVVTAAGTIPVRLDIGADPFLIKMTKAKVFATCYHKACSKGRISGAVSEQQIDAKIIPELAQIIQAVVSADCPGPGPESCAADSTGKTLQDLFDENDDLVITADELRNNDLIQSILAPDLDLVKADGTPGKDGEKDALSFGFGFTTVHATLVRP